MYEVLKLSLRKFTVGLLQLWNTIRLKKELKAAKILKGYQLEKILHYEENTIRVVFIVLRKNVYMLLT